MKIKASFLFASSLLFSVLAACSEPAEATVDLGAGECVVPASLGYECPNGNCPDAQGCNWCSCTLGTPGNTWACTQRACLSSYPDAGAPTGCSTDSDCGGSQVCRFFAGCTSSLGSCFSPGEKFFYDCAISASQATTACLCDGTTKKLEVDCSGVSQQFAHLGACE